eukprot:5522122-Ditylum_brightwellii.AAC.1
MNNDIAFKNAVHKISEQHLEEDEAHDDFKGSPQVVHLPFVVEETITAWEMQAFPFQDNQFLCDFGNDWQYVFVLSAIFKKVKTRYITRKKGVFCMFKTPEKELSDKYDGMDVKNAIHDYNKVEHLGM